MAAFRRLSAVVLAMAFVAVPAIRVAASTSDDLDAARAKLADARTAANDAAADFAAARDELGATQNHIAQLQATIDTDKARAAALQTLVQQRAVFAYVHAGQDLEIVVGATDAITALRQQELLDHANQTDDTSIKKLAAVKADLEQQQAALQKEEAQEQDATDALASKQSALLAKVEAAQQATDALQAQLDAEIAAAAAADKARLEAEQAALQAAQPVTTSSDGGSTPTVGSPGTILNNRVVNGFTCPVTGAAYSDDFGGPTGHPGNDLFVPIGTPVVAVKAGSVFYMANDGAGGNEAYVNADDGNTYYYAHLSAFVGGARAVSQGELIGYSGMTGNATAPHVHFEIRIGGPNGNRIDPFPTLKSAGC
jgi:murein DD-endopeptidase MepM/ murein hydrolase activator NlpD